MYLILVLVVKLLSLPFGIISNPKIERGHAYPLGIDSMFTHQLIGKYRGFVNVHVIKKGVVSVDIHNTLYLTFILEGHELKIGIMTLLCIFAPSVFV